MILSAQTIHEYANFYGMITPFYPKEIKIEKENISYGLGPAGYSIRISETITLKPQDQIITFSIESFNIPKNIKAKLSDKSTWARKHLSVFNTNIQPGWKGILAIEIVNHGLYPITIEYGWPIAEIEFHFLDKVTDLPYRSFYMNQKRNITNV